MENTHTSGAQIGRRRPRIDAFQQVTGQVEYCNDLRFPGMLYAKPVLSTEHHARIRSIDTSAAERMRGVKAVATAKDAPDNVGGLIIPDQPVYAGDKVRYRGEIVALVAAQDEEPAAEAASLVKVEYEPLPPVFDPREALEPGAPVIHEDGQGKWCRGNQVLPHGHEAFFLAYGDVERGLEESDLVVEHTFGTSAQRCAPLEGHAFIARPEGVDRISIIGNTQMPFWHQPAVAKALRLPLNRVRMVSTPIGGAFGQKNDITIEPNLAVLAMKIGRPVKWAMTTEEDFLFTSTKIPVYLTYKVGVKSDGTLVAIDRRGISNTGAYASTTMITMNKCTLIGAGPYKVPNHRAETLVVYTNKCRSAAFRGFGMSQPTFAIEIMMDIVAERLGMDRLEFRMRNLMHDGDRAATGQAMRAVGIQACLERVAELSGWNTAG